MQCSQPSRRFGRELQPTSIMPGHSRRKAASLRSPMAPVLHPAPRIKNPNIMGYGAAWMAGTRQARQ